jgi:hypothetical protein
MSNEAIRGDPEKPRSPALGIPSPHCRNIRTARLDIFLCSSIMSLENPLKVLYKEVNGSKITTDVYLPPTSSTSPQKYPVCEYHIHQSHDKHTH